MTSASWKNRRRMAWMSFTVVVGFAIGIAYRLFIVGDDPTTWTGIVWIVLGGFIGIVLGYSGFATLEQIKTRPK